MAAKEKIGFSQIAILISGTDIPVNLMDNLVEVVVDTTLYLPSMFTLRFHDDALEWVDHRIFKLGEPVEIKLGAVGKQPKRVIAGEITGIEPNFAENTTATLTIRGYDRAHRLNRGAKTRAFVQMSDSEIVSQVGQAAGLGVKADATSGSHPHLFQDNQTDLAFVHELARRNGYEIFVDDKTLYFRKPKGNRGTVPLKWGEELHGFAPRLTLAGQVDEVIVKGWDPVKKQELVGKATRSSIAPDIGAGQSGGSEAKKAFSSAKQVVVHQPVDSQPEADALAQSILDEINAEYVEAEGVADGDPSIVAGSTVEIANLGKRFSGKYVVTSASHVYMPGSYEVFFRVEGPRPVLVADLVATANANSGVDSRWVGVVPAVVTDNKDNEGMGRVKLKFPWFDSNVSSDWARIATIGAGDKRGVYWLPEVNDEVLVAFEYGDFDRPYVVGSLYNGKDKPPEATNTVVKGGKVEMRLLKTRTGHTIKLVDDSSSSMIEIVDADSKNRITLDMKGNQLIIKSQGKVVIESQGETNIKSTSNMSLKSNGNINVEATGQLVLKGATVNIN